MSMGDDGRGDDQDFDDLDFPCSMVYHSKTFNRNCFFKRVKIIFLLLVRSFFSAVEIHPLIDIWILDKFNCPIFAPLKADVNGNINVSR